MVTCQFFAAEFSIWTREAGAGGLSIAVEGPSKAEIAFEDRKDGSCGVSYIVQEPGITLKTLYIIHIHLYLKLTANGNVIES